jgi:hypothetical protein
MGVGNGNGEETKPIGDVVGLPISVLRVDGRPASAPGLEASGPCIVHASSESIEKEIERSCGNVEMGEGL